MPQLVVAAAVKWVTATLVEWGVNLLLAAAISYTAVYGAIFYGISALGRSLGPKLGTGGLNQTSPLQLTRNPVQPRRVIYGRTRVSGPMVDAFVAGASNEYLHMVVALAGHECEEIGDVYFNDEVVPLDGAGNATGTYAGYATVKKHLGAAGQAADADYVAGSGGTRAATDRFDQIAYLYPRLKWDQSKWPGGLPNPSAIVKGKKVFDPRTNTTGWSDNPALCVRDYLTNSTYGLAVDAATEIDDASFIAAANVCDEAVALSAGGTEKRYTCNGSFELSAQPATVIEMLLDSMAGGLVYVGGKWVCYAGAHQTPDPEPFDENILRGPISVQTKMSLRDTCNRVRGVFTSPDDKWQPADFTPIVNGFYLGEDGGVEIWRDLELPFTTSHSMAQRIAKIELERTRQDITVTLPCKLSAFRTRPGSVIKLNNTRFGWTNKQFLVTGSKLNLYNTGGAMALGVDITVRETAAEMWDWNSGEETTYDPAPNTNLRDSRLVPAPLGLALAVATLAERTALPRIKATWTAPSDQFVKSGGFTEIEYKKHADADWLLWSRVAGATTVEYINDVLPGTNTDVRIRHINNSGVPGAYSGIVSIVAAAGMGTYTALLTNEAHSVSCLADGTPISGELGAGGRAKTTILAFAGSVPLVAVAAAPGAGQFAFSIATLTGTATWAKESDSVARCESITSESAIGRVTIDLEGLLTVTKDFSITKVTSGTDGDDGTNGDDATVIWLVPDAAAVAKDNAGSYTPATLNLSAFSRTGLGAPAGYAGRFKIATFDGSAWTDQYTSGGNEATKAYAVPASILAIRCRLYLAGGTATLLDEQIVPIVSDGTDGVDGANAGELVGNPDFSLGNDGSWDSAFASWTISNVNGELSWGAKATAATPFQLVNTLHFRCRSGERYAIRAHILGVACWARITFFDTANNEIFYITTPNGVAGWSFVAASGLVPKAAVWGRAEVLSTATNTQVDLVRVQYIAPGTVYNAPETTVPAVQWESLDIGGGARNVTLINDDPSSTIHYSVNGGSWITYGGTFGASQYDYIRTYASRSGYSDSDEGGFALP